MGLSSRILIMGLILLEAMVVASETLLIKPNFSCLPKGTLTLCPGFGVMPE